MNQQTLSGMETPTVRRKTRREKFLNTMDGIVPWTDWVEQIRPYYPDGIRGRQPRGIEVMLRMYLLQEWFGLSAESTGDAIYDSYSMHAFLYSGSIEGPVPDASTLLRFRHFLEKHGLEEKFHEELEKLLQERGLMLHRGSITDAGLTARRGNGKKGRNEADSTD